jgi:GTP-binding protein EngB required for normal cell division
VTRRISSVIFGAAHQPFAAYSALCSGAKRFERYLVTQQSIWHPIQVVDPEKEEREIKQRMYDWFKRVNFDTVFTTVRRAIKGREKQKQREN